MDTKELEERMHLCVLGMSDITNKNLDAKTFAKMAVCLVNFMTITNLIEPLQRKDAAYYLCKAFSMGLKTKLSETVINDWAEAICKSTALEMDMIQDIIDYYLFAKL